MKDVANLVGLLIVGLVILGLARRPQILRTFFSGTQGVLGLLVQK